MKHGLVLTLSRTLGRTLRTNLISMLPTIWLMMSSLKKLPSATLSSWLVMISPCKTICILALESKHRSALERKNRFLRLALESKRSGIGFNKLPRRAKTSSTIQKSSSRQQKKRTKPKKAQTLKLWTEMFIIEHTKLITGFKSLNN